jgi:hydroxymethylglutaryl-CoA reductase
MGSDIPGLYRLDMKKRLEVVAEKSGCSIEDLGGFVNESPNLKILDVMVENVIGVFELPVGIATNFLINGVDRLIPMATEEPSVIAAASKGAKIARQRGGFSCSTTDPVMIGQVQIVDIDNPDEAVDVLRKSRDDLIELANSKDPMLLKFGGGCRDIEIRRLQGEMGEMLVLHLLVDCRDAMGANAVNTMAEAVAPEAERLTGGVAILRIISNLAIHRLARARAVFRKEDIGGEEGVELFLLAQSLAKADPFRATTQNKGVMNGVSAVVRATGNDTRAVEAGVHSYASYKGKYGPVTDFHADENGDLVGKIEIPVPVGLIGGATKVHPAARSAIKLLGIDTSSQLGEILAAVGLAQNFAALRALSREGIQKGHMKLHARNLAIQAGADIEESDRVVVRMIGSGTITASNALEVLKEIRKKDSRKP